MARKSDAELLMDEYEQTVRASERTKICLWLLGQKLPGELDEQTLHVVVRAIEDNLHNRFPVEETTNADEE